MPRKSHYYSISSHANQLEVGFRWQGGQLEGCGLTQHHDVLHAVSSVNEWLEGQQVAHLGWCANDGTAIFETVLRQHDLEHHGNFFGVARVSLEQDIAALQVRSHSSEAQILAPQSQIRHFDAIDRPDIDRPQKHRVSHNRQV